MKEGLIEEVRAYVLTLIIGRNYKRFKDMKLKDVKNVL
jgi:hypothetical protein